MVSGSEMNFTLTPRTINSTVYLFEVWAAFECEIGLWIEVVLKYRKCEEIKSYLVLLKNDGCVNNLYGFPLIWSMNELCNKPCLLVESILNGWYRFCASADRYSSTRTNGTSQRSNSFIPSITVNTRLHTVYFAWMTIKYDWSIWSALL